MKTSIEVVSRQEAAQIRRGLADPQVRAFVKVMGVLAALPSDRARVRVLHFVDDQFAEQDGRPSAVDWWAAEQRAIAASDVSSLGYARRSQSGEGGPRG